MTIPRWVFVVLGLLVLVAGLYMIEPQLPRGVASLPGSTSRPVQAVAHLVPQGWAFFTKSPMGESFSAYSDEGGHLASLSDTPHSSPANMFGMDRRSRKQVAELTLLLSTLKPSEWTTCPQAVTDSCLRTIPADGHAVRNTEPSPMFCGDVVVVGRELTPWSYRQLVSDKLVDKRIIRLDITCERH